MQKKIVDIGGGQGILIANLLRLNPNAKGVDFDLAEVIETAKPKLDAEYKDIKDRLELVSGDFFKSVPSGADVITFKVVLHDWTDEKAVEILKVVHTALPAHGKLVLIEHVIRENDPSGISMDITMLVLTDGKERTEPEWTKLLHAAGFKPVKFSHLAPTPFFTIEAEKL